MTFSGKYIHLFSRISLKIEQLDALLADAGLKRGKDGPR